MTPNCNKNCICEQLTQLQTMSGTISRQSTLTGSVSNRSSSLTGSVSNRGIVNGTKDYEELINKPSIETVTLIGDKSFEELGLSPLDGDDLLNILI